MQIRSATLLRSVQPAPRFAFSIIPNIRNPAELSFGPRTYTYDEHLQRYPISSQIYLKRRRMSKRQVWPKILILPNLVPQIAHDLSSQWLSNQLQYESILKLSDTDTITSGYVLGRFLEPHLKQLLDEYARKVLICGRTPPLASLPKYQQIRDKVVELYRVFFFGEQITQFESEVELKYLMDKQIKFMKYVNHRDNLLYRCKWTDSNQRCLEQYVNWQSRPVTEYADFRPLFYPLDTSEKLIHHRRLLQMNNTSWLQKLKFKFISQWSFIPKTKAHLKWILQFNMVRLLHWCNSMEFLRVMRIPPDFQIELAVVNFHSWLLRDRLKRQPDFASQYLVKLIDFTMKGYTMEKVGKLSIKKKNQFLKNVSQMMKLNLNVLSYHFNQSKEKDKRIKIDALIWSTVFLEKVERYSDEVYIFSEYAIRSYQTLQQLPLEKVMSCMVEFDALSADYDFKQQLQKINPPLSEQQFQKQFTSDRKDKKYYYSYGLPNVVMPMLDERANVKPSQIRKSNFLFRLLRIIRKYEKLDNYDYYNEVERQQKQRKQQRKTGWATEQQGIQAINRQFDLIGKIKKGGRK